MIFFTLLLFSSLNIYSQFEYKNRKFDEIRNHFNGNINMIFFTLKNNPGDTQEAKNLANSGNLLGLFEVFNYSSNSPSGDVALVFLSSNEIYIAKAHQNGSTKTFSDIKRTSFKDFMRDSCLLIYPNMSIPVHPGGSLY